MRVISFKCVSKNINCVSARVTGQMRENHAICVRVGNPARKGMGKNTCVSCKEIFGSTEKLLNLDINIEHFAYFDSINRGGLIYPTNFLFNIFFCSYCIFNSCISQLVEG